MAQIEMCEMCKRLNNIVRSTAQLRADNWSFQYAEQPRAKLDARLQRLRRYVHRLPAQSPKRREVELVKRTLQELLEEIQSYPDYVPLHDVLEEVDRFLFLAENEGERHMCSNCDDGGQALTDICDEILQQFVEGDLPTARRCIRDLMEMKSHDSIWESMPWRSMPSLK